MGLWQDTDIITIDLFGGERSSDLNLLGTISNLPPRVFCRANNLGPDPITPLQAEMIEACYCHPSFTGCRRGDSAYKANGIRQTFSAVKMPNTLPICEIAVSVYIQKASSSDNR